MPESLLKIGSKCELLEIKTNQVKANPNFKLGSKLIFLSLLMWVSYK